MTSRPGRVWYVTSRLKTGKSLPFFTVCCWNHSILIDIALSLSVWSVGRARARRANVTLPHVSPQARVMRGPEERPNSTFPDPVLSQFSPLLGPHNTGDMKRAAIYSYMGWSLLNITMLSLWWLIYDRKRDVIKHFAEPVVMNSLLPVFFLRKEIRS